MQKKIKKHCTLGIRKLTKKYNIGDIKEFYALQDINFETYCCESLVIFGSSGSGKTTLFNCIIGSELPTEGYIFFDKTNILSLTKTEKSLFLKKNVGKVYPYYNLIEYLTVIENLLLKLEFLNLKCDIDYLNELLDILELKHLKYVETRKLNHLNYCLVSVIKELIFKPSYLFLDEPDVKLQRNDKITFFEKIKYLTNKYKLTTIFFTSDVNISMKASRVIRIDSGKVI